MNERELARALLQQSESTQPSAEQITARILARDRRRVLVVTALTVITWLIAFALLIAVLVIFGFLFPRQAQLMMDIEKGQLSAQERIAIQATHFAAFAKAALLSVFAIAILAVASLGSLLLMFLMRRATLRQINASLREISEQLKRIGPFAPGGA
jgi:amino acid transporter